MVSVRPNLISPLSGCGRSSPKLFKLCIYFLGRQQIYVSRASLPIRKYLRASKSQHLPTGAPQYQIGKDRVDFAVFVTLLAPEEIKIIVECDQTKEQSAREKRRDHDLQDYNIRLRLFERHGRVPNFDRLVAIAVS
jgi:hypothetical protein